MANINEYVKNIKTAVYGKDVRSSLASGLEAVNQETEVTKKTTQDTKERQNSIETRWDEVLANTTDGAEVIDGRYDANGVLHSTIGSHVRSIGQDLIKASSSDIKTFDSVAARFTWIDSDLKNRGVNIEWFGADKNGIKDSTKAIQQAIDYLGASGGVIFVPQGTFLLTQILNITKSNIKLIGSGLDSILTIRSNYLLDGTRIQFENCSNISITDLVIEENNEVIKRSNIYSTVSLHDVSNFTMQDVEIRRSNGVGIHGIAAKNVKISKCHIHNTKADGIHFQRGSKDIIISDCLVINNEDDSIAVVSHDVKTYGYCERVTITNCITGRQQNGAVGSGIAIIGVIGAVVNGCLVSETGLSGIRVTEINDGASNLAVVGNVNITNNQIINTGLTISQESGLVKDGISIFNGRNVMVSNNQIRKVQGSGVFIGGSCVGIDVVNNRVSDIKNRGVWVSPLLQKGDYLQLWTLPQFEDGRLEQFVSCHEIVIKNNIITKTNMEGTYVDGAKTYNIIFEGNSYDYIGGSNPQTLIAYISNVIGYCVVKSNVFFASWQRNEYFKTENISGKLLKSDNHPASPYEPTYIGGFKHSYAGEIPNYAGEKVGEKVFSWNPYPGGPIGWVFTNVGWKPFGQILE